MSYGVIDKLSILFDIFLVDVLCFLSILYCIMQKMLISGSSRHQGKTSFVEHRTFFHLYHSFHRLWIFLFMMFQVCTWIYSHIVIKFWKILAVQSAVFSTEFCFLSPQTCKLCNLNWHLVFSSACYLFFQGLAIVAFNDEKFNGKTLREVLSLGPTFFVMKFFESMYLSPMSFLMYFLVIIYLYFQFFISFLGVLDIFMMYGAYSTTRRTAITRIFLRFLWFSGASVFLSFIYVYVYAFFCYASSSFRQFFFFFQFVSNSTFPSVCAWLQKSTPGRE